MLPGMDAMYRWKWAKPRRIDKKLSGNHEQKTRFFIKPNLMQLHSSYVVTDPKGTILVECGKPFPAVLPGWARTESPTQCRKARSFMSLIRSRYSRTINFKKSMHYNPFCVSAFGEGYIKTGDSSDCQYEREGKSGDDFGVEGRDTLHGFDQYIYSRLPRMKQNFSTLW